MEPSIDLHSTIDDLYHFPPLRCEKLVENEADKSSLPYKDDIDSLTLPNDNSNEVVDGPEDQIDTSWIQDSERYHHISENQQREPMTSIGTYFIYINKQSYIEKILFENRDLEINADGEFSYLTKETVLKIIQDKKIKTPNSKYKILDILSFNIDIEPNKMNDFINYDIFDSDLEKEFLKVLPIFNDIHISKSIFVYHSINRLYFIFQEVDHHLNHRTTLKSILKKGVIDPIVSEVDKSQIDPPPLQSSPSDPSPITNNNTKKVRIIDHPRELRKISDRGRFTRKRHL